MVSQTSKGLQCEVERERERERERSAKKRQTLGISKLSKELESKGGKIYKKKKGRRSKREKERENV